MTGVSVTIGADTSGLEAGVKRSKTQMSELQTEMGSVVGSAAALGAAAAAAGIAIVAGLATAGLAAVDAQAKLARQMGGTITGLRSLEGAAGDAGVSAAAISTAMQKLNVTIGRAQSGNEAAAESFKRLGLNAGQLARMDVDQRMAAIADAVKGLGLSSSEASAALANMGIRQSEITNLVTQGGDAIRKERDTVNALGLSISAIDAAQIEAANDAMGIFGDIMQGVQTQLAIEVAPIITALANMLEETAIEAGGVGEATSTAFGYIVEAAAFVISAIDGIKRVFEIVRDGIIIGITYVAQKFAELYDAIFSLLSKLPGVDFSETIASLDAFAAESKGIIKEAAANIDETLNKPLAGEKFKQFVAEAKEQSQVAAEVVVSNQQMMADNVVSIQQGMTDKQRENLAARLETLRASMLSETEALMEKYASDLELLRLSEEAKLLTKEEFQARELQLTQAHTDALTAIQKRDSDQRAAEDKRREQNRQQILGSAWSGLTTLMNSESRKMFEIGKAAAISNAVVSTYQGMSRALELGFPLGFVAAAAVGAAGFANVASIRSQSFGSGGGGGGGAASATQQINANATPAGGDGDSGGGGSYRFEGLTSGQFVSSEAVIEVLKQAQKDGALRGQISFTA